LASLIFNSALEDEAEGRIDFDTDTFKVMLVTSSYAPNKDTHTKRSDVTDEVSGTGYAAGGEIVVVTGLIDLANDRFDISLGGGSWAAATFTARGAVYYKSRGGAASADELIAYNDFGSDKGVVGGTLTLAASTFRKTNTT
jgi:hypothetical protein